MWRFILVTFAFLGWSFYELSDGSDYAPRANSIQARAIIGDTRPVARPLPAQPKRLAEAATPRPSENVTHSLAALADLRPADSDRVQVRLASADASDVVMPAIAVARPEQSQDPADTLAQAVARDVALAGAAVDTRHVAGSAVNLRVGPGTQYDRISRLTRGQEVRVLQDPGNGWIKLRVAETGRVGWMAERLVTASN